MNFLQFGMSALADMGVPKPIKASDQFPAAFSPIPEVSSEFDPGFTSILDFSIF
ncbi:MAG: hypothetical protein OQK50_03895 [Deltaproteobacteria bacterium]|nr:hypothetical protein [Deltaproteobacteria bacterium]MCW8892495.1 hypothetical protein [Deltaproteobacteria bacterium]MCW9049457.1 hypothetical protein [Deltaproteobacteria bacterium]